jgi:hypothetical protein
MTTRVSPRGPRLTVRQAISPVCGAGCAVLLGAVSRAAFRAIVP